MIAHSEFMTSAMTAKSPRQAFFSRFSREAVKVLASNTASVLKPPTPLILLTGGLRTYDGLCNALEQGHAQLLGIGRASVLCPEMPRLLAESIALCPEPGSGVEKTSPVFLRNALPEPNLDLPTPLALFMEFVPLPKLIGAGVGMAWYIVQMRRIARAEDPDYSIGGLGAVVKMWAPQQRLSGGVMAGWCVIILLSVGLAHLLSVNAIS